MSEIGELIQAARIAGLELRAEGKRLVLSGPSGAEEIARELLARKCEVISYMAFDRKPGPAPREIVIDPATTSVGDFRRLCRQVFDPFQREEAAA